MRRFVFFTLLAAGLISCSTLWAQRGELMPYEFTHIQQKDGLSSRLINCLFKDTDGFLWVGTNSGLNRFDGSHFTVFKHNPANLQSIGNSTVYAICQDKTGHLWVATDDGISEFNLKTGQFKSVRSVNGQLLGICYNILCDRSGTIWFSSKEKGLYRHEPSAGRFIHYTHNPQKPTSLSENYIARNGLLEDPIRNGLWIATRRHGGLNYLDVASGTFENYRHNPSHLPIYTPHFTSALALDGTHLLFSDNADTEAASRIVMIDLKSKRIIRTIKPVSQTGYDTFELQTIFVDRRHNLWISSWNYVMFYVEAATYQVTELMHDDARRTSVAGSSFWSGYQQPDGTIWLGTINGISSTNPERALYEVRDLVKPFPFLTESEGISSFIEDQDGSWWLGTRTRGLLHYNPVTGQRESFRLPHATAPYLYGAMVRKLVDYGPELLLASLTHLFRFSKRTKQFTAIPLPAYFSDNHIELLDLMLQQHQLWLFSFGKRVFNYDLLTGDWRSYLIEVASTDPYFLACHALMDQRNTLWLNIQPGGFAQLSPQNNRFTPQKAANQPPFNTTVYSMTSDSAGYFWMATGDHGLARFDPRQRRYQFWTEADGLFSNHCMSALPDRLGHIWVGSYNTFTVFSPDHSQFLTFTLPFNEAHLIHKNFLWPLRNGHVLAALGNYLIEFKPEILARLNNQKGVTLLTNLITPDSTYLLSGPDPAVQLGATDNSFSIQYSVLSASTSQPYQYLYKLEGYDNKWYKAGLQNTAWYNKLPGGDYVFQVKALSSSNQSTPVRSLAIHVDTLFYNTSWFRALLLLTLLGIGVTLIRARVKQTARLHHLQVQASRLERDKTEIQYQNLINHLNPHFLFNSLTSLGSLIIIDPKQASGFLQKLSTIYRYILQNKEKDTVSLASELAFVQHYVELQQAQFEDGLQIRIDVSANYLSHEIVPVTLQNLFENAIKHNTTEEDSPLRIWVYVADEYLWVVNNLQRKPVVKTSNKQGLDSLKKLYAYLSDRPLLIEETADMFVVKIPLL